jgi:hypothetical protein
MLLPWLSHLILSRGAAPPTLSQLEAIRPIKSAHACAQQNTQIYARYAIYARQRKPETFVAEAVNAQKSELQLAEIRKKVRPGCTSYE